MGQTNLLMHFWLTLQLIADLWIILHWPQWANISLPLLALLWLLARTFLRRLQYGRGHTQRNACIFLILALIHFPLGLIGAYAILPTLRGRLLHNAKLSEALVRRLLLLATLFISGSVVVILLFILVRGLWSTSLSGRLSDWHLFFAHVRLDSFLLSLDWSPTAQPPGYGILAFIIGSLYMTFLALLISLPLSIAVAIFIAELAPPRLARMAQGVVELLAGVPSVLFGFIGVMLVAPWIRNLIPVSGNNGFNVLSGSLVLALMILPTITNVAVTSISAVGRDLRLASQALGATQWLTTVRVVLPKARRGIVTGIILGISRAVGETIAVVMVAGNPTRLARSPLDPVRSLTMNIVSEMSYAQDDPSVGNFHLTALFASALVLLLLVILFNFAANNLPFAKEHR